jgi:hypothetical protein
MSKVLSAHQPNFMPYLGFFDKMKQSDVFVIRDEVLFVKDDYHRRNKIRINGNDNVNNPQSKWLGVPVKDPHDYLKYAEISETGQKKTWQQQLVHEVQTNYGRAAFFPQYFSQLRQIVESSGNGLVEFNMKVIEFLSRAFGITTPIVMASSLGLKPEHYEKSNASEDLVAICKALGADVYLSGSGGRGYLDLEPFKREGIEVRFQDYQHPVYEQAFPGFLPNMSAIDALFCLGGMPEAVLVENAATANK